MRRRRIVGSLFHLNVADDQELVRAGFAMVIGSQPDMAVVGQARDGDEILLTAIVIASDNAINLYCFLFICFSFLF